MREADIRPEHLLRRYLELSAEDARRCFAGLHRNAIPCVACGSTALHHEFDKNEFGYALCESCGTLFQNPRPPVEAFTSFYCDSASSRYWAEEFFPSVAEARRGAIFRPRVERLRRLCRDKSIEVGHLVDVGAGYGIFLEEWRSVTPGVEAVAIEPSGNLAQICRDKGFRVIEAPAEDVRGIDGFADLVVCFEVLEHVYDPVLFLKVLAGLARPGGYVFVSTLGIDGFDIQLLWEKSNSIFPPHHINFLSLAGFEHAFARAGLVDIDITTPGRLDVDIVRNAFRRDPSILSQNRFARLLLGDERRAEAFQDFLAENRLSSHVWVMGRKPEAGAR